jgi:hypothetical protein
MHGRLRSITALLAVCLAGAGTAVAFAGDNSGRGGGDDDDGTTTGETTTGTTTTGTTTTGTTTTGTTTTNTTPAPAPRRARAPRVEEIEVDGLSRRRLRLRTELAGRVTRVRFVYRGRTYRARRGRSNTFTRVVRARGGDHLDDRVIRFRVRACNGSRCISRLGRDEA